jgi:hypothetical protein
MNAIKRLMSKGCAVFLIIMHMIEFIRFYDDMPVVDRPEWRNIPSPDLRTKL